MMSWRLKCAVLAVPVLNVRSLLAVDDNLTVSKWNDYVMLLLRRCRLGCFPVE